MNRNYKVIWNASLNCFMAVSEYAKARGKSSKSSMSSNATINTTSNLSSTRIFRITTIWLGLVAAGFSMQAIAAPCDASTEIKCGINATTGSLHGIAIGKNATVLGSQGIAIGGGSSGQNTTASGEQSIAIGANVVSLGASSIAIGGDDLDAASKTNYDGSISTGALNSGQVNMTFHEYAGRDLLESWDAYGHHTEASGAASIAMGTKARSAGNLATAMGTHSSAAGMASSAFGIASAATGQGALALGAGANSSTQDGVALGSRSVANVASGALGFAPTSASAADQSAITATNSTNLGAVSIGSAKEGTRQIVNLAAGTNDSDAVNVSQLKSLANVMSKSHTRYYSVNDNGVAKANYNNDGATGGNSMAAGIAATADGTFATAIGTEANAQGYASMALGNEADATKTNSLALGRQSKATGVNSTALGWEASASAENSMAMGREAKAEGANNIALGRAANTFGRNSTALGFQASASANNSMALGTEAKASTAKSIALGEGATATHEGSVALGSGSLADGLTLGVFAYQPLDKNGNPIEVVAPTASSELSVGAVSNERRITNVAAGATDTDAVNVSQLKSVVAYTDDTVEANKTRFYSVNSTDSTRGNYNNDGAIGVDAIAAGIDAQAAGDRAVAMGTSASATGSESTALGAAAQAFAGSATAVGSGVQADQYGATAMGTNSRAQGMYSTAVGHEAEASGENTVAMGKKSQAAMDGATALGSNAYAKGIDATAVGNKAQAGRNSIALGMDANALNSGTVALGTQSFAGQGATVVGTNAKANGKDSTALGRFAKANDTDSVALGSFSETATAVGTSNVVLVNQTYGFAGAVPKGTVSVGSLGNERTITNVAAGRINDTSTDAINGSQLYATNSVVSKNSSDIDLGLNFTGDNSVTTVNRKLGDKLTVKGGATTALSDKNIGVVADSSNNSLTVKLAKNIDLGASGSVKMGTSSPFGLGPVTTVDRTGMTTGNALASTDVNGLGVFVNGPLGIPSTALTVDGLNIIGGPSVTRSGGIDAGNKRITRVSNGINPTDAVNMGQLTGAAAGSRTEVKAGTNIADVEKTVGDKGQDIYTVNAKGSTAAAGSSAVTVNGNDVGDNITDYTVDLSQDTKDSLVKANNSVQYDSSARTRVTLGGGGTAPVTLTNVAEGDISENSSDAVNGSQLFKTNTKVNKGFGLKAADGQMVVKQLGDQVEVVGANNNITTKVIDGKVAVDLNNNLDLGKTGSVKMGNTTVSRDGMTIVAPTVARTVVLSSAGLNNGGNKITNVLAGTQDTDAVNVKQLNLANTTIDKGLSFGGDSGTDVNRKLGETLTVKGGDTINADPATKNISVTANGEDTLTVRLAKDINLGETGSVTTGNTQVNNAGITLYRGGNDQVALTNNGLNNGNNKITNVAQGTTSKDAVNFDQLSLTNTNVSTNAAGIKTNKDNIAKGIKIGDGNSANDQQFALGSTINVTGDSNITTTASATGVQVKLNNQLNLGDDGRMQMGTSLMNNTGFTFVGNEPGRTVILGAGGLNNGFNRITNVAAGLAPTDAATVGQLNAATFALDKGWALSAQGDEATMVKQGSAFDLNSRDGNIKISRTAAASSVGRVSRAVDPNDMTFDLNRDIAIDSVQTGDTTINNEGLTIVGGPSVTKAGINAADTKVTNVVNGEVAANSKDAINGGQLYAQGAGISSIIGGNTTYDPVTGTFTNSNIGGTGQASIDGAIASIKRGEAVMTESIQTNTTNITTNTSNITKNTANIATNTANISTNTTNIKANKDKIDAGLNFGADSGAVINKPIGDGSVMSFKGGNNIKTTAEGSSIKFDLNGNINVESVTTGNTTVNNSGVTIKNGPSMTAAGIYAGNTETAPSMTAAGINAAGTKVTNVADGMAPRDAVNYGQLEAVTRGLGGSINELGYKIGEVEDDANAGISAAMAMSSLPQAYIIGKPMIGGGIATFNGESAVAIGFSKMSNDGRWVMKLNGTADTQGNVGGAIGAGFHFD